MKGLTRENAVSREARDSSRMESHPGMGSSPDKSDDAVELPDMAGVPARAKA